MKKHGVILTQNYQPVKILRFSTDVEAEAAYQEYKRMGHGVVKIYIEKAHELNVMYI